MRFHQHGRGINKVVKTRLFLNQQKNYINQRERGKIEAAPPGLTQPKNVQARGVSNLLYIVRIFFSVGGKGGQE